MLTHVPTSTLVLMGDNNDGSNRKGSSKTGDTVFYVEGTFQFSEHLCQKQKS